MAASFNTRSRQVLIQNELGLHARVAAGIAKIAQLANSNVWMIKGRDKVNAASVIDLLTLACPKGSTVTLTIDDGSDMKILNRIVEMMERGFEE
ncbi:MAG: HPr family phosphocarrier protein [Desulfobacterales bacterium]|jgi:phosphocarrier protein|nr:HPr family phosphocarrier protein [Desulfobacterales bacterium]MDP7353945.1 HPr family phosphocarrier protein [Desulfobacterales bacterium]|tara:strand:+ start:207 stop:488 length:282 start_codon:yes stop_codon:yes gene_type:complete